MKKIIIIMLASLLVGNCFAWGDKNKNPVKYSVKTYVVTNTLEKSDYDNKTNGYSYMVNASSFPRVVEEKVNYGWMGTDINCLTTTTNYSINWVSANQWTKQAPDPFKVKVTVKCYVIIQNECYTIHVGPMSAKYATKKTVIKRWQTILRQKINMSETTETRVE